MAARSCKSPEGCRHEVLSSLLAQRPYYNTDIKIRGQDLEGWSLCPGHRARPKLIPTPVL